MLQTIRPYILSLTLALLLACGTTSPATDIGVDTSDVGSDVQTDATEDSSEDIQEEVVDVPPPPPPTPPTCRFAPYTETVFEAPFPTDALLSSDGTIDLSLFPGRGASNFVDKYLIAAETKTDGFSTNTGIYLSFDEPLDTTLFPSPVETLEDGSPIFLVNVNQESPLYGQKVPLILDFWEPEGVFYLPNTLIAHPLWGFVLEPASTYALVVTSNFPGHADTKVQANDEFLNALNDEDTAPTAWREALAPLRVYLDSTNGQDEAEIVCGTVFSTADPTRELAELQPYILSLQNSPLPDMPYQFDDMELSKATAFFDRYEGTYQSPNFQSGTKPYLAEGGEFQYDEEGHPIVQNIEVMDIAIGIPTVVTMPPDGWPVIIHSHGTGGDYRSHFKGQTGANGSPAGRLASLGIASIGIDQPLHGNRCLKPTCIDKNIISFNVFNPSAVRWTFRQSAVDTSYLINLLVSGADFQDKDGNTVRFDTSKIFFFGHSQGGQSGALLAAVEARIGGFLISGMGGGLALAIYDRKDIADFAQVVRNALLLPECDAATESCELSPLHPALSLVQGIVDVVDPINYGSLWISGEITGRPANILMTQGLEDLQTPPTTAEALAIAAGIPVVDPPVTDILGLEILGIEPLTLPASNNIVAEDGTSSSAVMFQFENFDHFAVFHPSSGAIPAYQSFFKSLVDGEPAQLTWDAP
ncbi:MAG: hypothetical protein CMH54_04105 [Myxococcales bacterium]|nr:hypothetical protein [Myxococcales bacterium]